MQNEFSRQSATLHDRQRVLSEDPGGTPEERQAIANALNALGTLRKK